MPERRAEVAVRARTKARCDALMAEVTDLEVRSRGERHLPDLPLEITIRRATADDLAQGFAARRRAKGAQRVA